MSEAKRYSNLDVWKALHFGENTNGWVKYEDYARLKAEAIRLQQVRDYEHYLSAVVGAMNQENARLKAEVERLKEGNECLDQMHEKEMARSAFLCEQVERLTKAVMHSPSAQLKLKELEGKTTYEEINSDNQ